jgi:hypothetical protein
MCALPIKKESGTIMYQGMVPCVGLDVALYITLTLLIEGKSDTTMFWLHPCAPTVPGRVG